MRDDLVYLKDIQHAIDQIEKYAAAGRERFERDELIRIWIVHHIQVIGEATQRLTPELRTKFADVPWKQIAAMRNILVHHYFRIDFEEVWSVVEKDLPTLKPKIEALVKQLDSPAPPVS